MRENYPFRYEASIKIVDLNKISVMNQFIQIFGWILENRLVYKHSAHPSLIIEIQICAHYNNNNNSVYYTTILYGIYRSVSYDYYRSRCVVSAFMTQVFHEISSNIQSAEIRFDSENVEFKN